MGKVGYRKGQGRRKRIPRRLNGLCTSRPMALGLLISRLCNRHLRALSSLISCYLKGRLSSSVIDADTGASRLVVDIGRAHRAVGKMLRHVKFKVVLAHGGVVLSALLFGHLLPPFLRLRGHALAMLAWGGVRRAFARGGDDDPCVTRLPRRSGVGEESATSPSD